jgi:hypothetical protein
MTNKKEGRHHCSVTSAETSSPEPTVPPYSPLRRRSKANTVHQNNMGAIVSSASALAPAETSDISMTISSNASNMDESGQANSLIVYVTDLLWYELNN